MPSENLHLTINLTDRCNLSCRYCPLEKSATAISCEALDKVRELIFRGGFKNVSVAYHGGEPLLEWDKITYLTDGIRQNIPEAHFYICTNGLEITVERATYMSDNGFQARVSCDGMPASQFANRIGPSNGEHKQGYDYSTIIRGIMTLRQAGVQTFINMVVSPETVADLTKNFLFLDRLNIEFIYVNPVMGAVWSDTALEQLRTRLSELAGLYSSSNVFFKQSFSSMMRNRIREIKYFLNEGGKYDDSLTLVIDPHGVIYSDEYDSKTVDSLTVGTLEECAGFGDLIIPETNYFDLIFSRRLFPDDALASLKSSYGALLEHCMETWRMYELA